VSNPLCLKRFGLLHLKIIRLASYLRIVISCDRILSIEDMIIAFNFVRLKPRRGHGRKCAGPNVLAFRPRMALTLPMGFYGSEGKCSGIWKIPTPPCLRALPLLSREPQSYFKFGGQSHQAPPHLSGRNFPQQVVRSCGLCSRIPRGLLSESGTRLRSCQ